MGSMKIGQLAKAAQVRVSTIRFYEDAGLLPKPPTRESGYREYGSDDLARLQLIKASKRQGFPLKEIRACLAALEGDGQACEEIAVIVHERLTMLNQELVDLKRLRDQLQARLKAFRRGTLVNEDCLCAILQSEPISKEKPL